MKLTAITLTDNLALTAHASSKQALQLAFTAGFRGVMPCVAALPPPSSLSAWLFIQETPGEHSKSAIRLKTKKPDKSG